MADQLLDTDRIAADQQRRISAALDVGLKALRPMLQFQVSLLRLWAHNAEMLARNCERGLEGLSSDAEQQEKIEQHEHERAGDRPLPCIPDASPSA